MFEARSRILFRSTSNPNGWFRALLLACAFFLAPSVCDTFAAQPANPGEVELEGALEVFHEDRQVGSRYVHFLNTGSERLELQFSKGKAPALKTGDHVRARGKKTKAVLALDSAGSVQTLSTALPNTFGVQKTRL